MRIKWGFYTNSLRCVLTTSFALGILCGCDEKIKGSISGYLGLPDPIRVEVEPMSIDFGQGPVGNSIHKELIIRNVGSSSIDVLEIEFREDSMPYSIHWSSEPIESNDQKSAMIEFLPEEVGEFTATLVVGNSGDDLEVIVRGEGIVDELCGDCNSRPNNHCITEFDLELYDMLGACLNSECKYQKRVIGCSGRCENDACVDNEVPQVSVSLFPNSAYTSDDLTVSASATDANGDLVTLRYQWFKNETLEPLTTTSTLTSLRTVKGEAWTVTVTPNDGEVDGPKHSAWVAIQNSLPVIGTTTVSPSFGTIATAFYCSPLEANDPDMDTVIHAFQWTVNAEPSVNTSTIEAVSFERGDVIVCTVTPDDGEQTGASVASASIWIENALPTAPTAAITPLNPTEVDDLVCSVVVDSMDVDNDPVTYNYSWTNGLIMRSSTTITSTHTTSRETWVCTVTPCDGLAEGPPGQASVNVCLPPLMGPNCDECHTPPGGPLNTITSSAACPQWLESSANGLYFTKGEVTVAQYEACVTDNGCVSSSYDTSTTQDCNYGDSSRVDHPMNCVTAAGADDYCAWMGARLPTEVEWAQEASDNANRDYPWGDTPQASCDYCIMNAGVPGCGANSTWSVCSKPDGDSVSKLCDMSGNVWEWTSTSIGSDRVITGGSWDSFDQSDLLASARKEEASNARPASAGFRCVSISAP